MTPKKKIRLRPSQKLGMESPSDVNAMASWSTQVLRRVAATTPADTPIKTSMATAIRVRRNVGSVRCQIASGTGMDMKSDSPRLPCSAPRNHRSN